MEIIIIIGLCLILLLTYAVILKWENYSLKRKTKMKLDDNYQINCSLAEEIFDRYEIKYSKEIIVTDVEYRVIYTFDNGANLWIIINPYPRYVTEEEIIKLIPREIRDWKLKQILK